MLKKRFTIVAIMTLIVFAMMMIIDMNNSIKEEEDIQTNKELVQKGNVENNVTNALNAAEC